MPERLISFIQTSIPRGLRMLRWNWMAILCLLLAGCDGCTEDPVEAERRKAENEKQKKELREAVQTTSVLPLPFNGIAKLQRVKSGHWTETTQLIKSNREDIRVVVTDRIQNRQKDVVMPNSNITLEYNRRTSLAKGQQKAVGLSLFFPSVEKSAATGGFEALTSYQVQSNLTIESANNLEAKESFDSFAELEPFQTHFIVLSNNAAQYQFLQSLDCFDWLNDRSQDEVPTVVQPYHLCLISPENDSYLFPSHLLTMTGVSFVLWDDVHPDQLTVQQQNALIDWLHWGGNLVISGPSSWGQLKDSFLSRYLPVASVESRNLSDDDFSEIRRQWTVRDLAPEPLRDTATLTNVSGVSWKLSERGSFMQNTGELVAEARVGRGRVCMTAFSVSNTALRNQLFFPNFVSTGILRRVPRKVQTHRFRDFTSLQPSLDESLSYEEPDLDAEFSEEPQSEASDEAAFTVRFEHVPLGSTSAVEGGFSDFRIIARDNLSTGVVSEPLDETSDPESTAGRSLPTGGNFSKWNDLSVVAVCAQEELRRSAGIVLPEKLFIIKLLGLYLVCLVPINYIVFRLVNRLELAWIVSPIIAIFGTFIAARATQLDIGFSRRNSEMSFLELQGDYSRAHLTRFSELYSSLSTNFKIEISDDFAAVLPVAEQRTRLERMTTRAMQVRYGETRGVLIDPLTVYSNTSVRLHSEEMVDVGGSVRVDTSNPSSEKLINGTNLSLRQVYVERPAESGGFEFAFLEEMASKHTEELQFQPVTQDSREKIITQAEQFAQSAELSSGKLYRQLVNAVQSSQSTMRMIAIVDKVPGNVVLNPTPESLRSSGLVYAELQRPSFPTPKPDPSIVSGSDRYRQRRFQGNSFDDAFLE